MKLRSTRKKQIDKAVEPVLHGALPFSASSVLLLEIACSAALPVDEPCCRQEPATDADKSQPHTGRAPPPCPVAALHRSPGDDAVLPARRPATAAQGPSTFGMSCRSLPGEAAPLPSCLPAAAAHAPRAVAMSCLCRPETFLSPPLRAASATPLPPHHTPVAAGCAPSHCTVSTTATASLLPPLAGENRRFRGWTRSGDRRIGHRVAA